MKVIIAYSKRRYTVYTEDNDKVVTFIFKGGRQSAETKAREIAGEGTEIIRLAYPVEGKRRAMENVTESFKENNSARVRKDLLPKFLNSINRTEDSLAIFYHGPFAYVKEYAAS